MKLKLKYKSIIKTFIISFFIVSCSNKYQVYEKTGFAGVSKNNKIISYSQKDSLIKITNKNNKVSKVYKVDDQLKLIYKDYASKNHVISIGPLKNLTEYDNIYLKLGKIGLIGFNIRVQ